MSEDQKKLLESQLFGITNSLQGKINVDEYRNFILCFIFYKYLSEKQYFYANKMLEGEKITDYKKATKLKLVCNPTCGSGFLLLLIAKEVENVSEFYNSLMNYSGSERYLIEFSLQRNSFPTQNVG